MTKKIGIVALFVLIGLMAVPSLVGASAPKVFETCPDGWHLDDDRQEGWFECFPDVTTVPSATPVPPTQTNVPTFIPTSTIPVIPTQPVNPTPVCAGTLINNQCIPFPTQTVVPSATFVPPTQTNVPTFIPTSTIPVIPTQNESPTPVCDGIIIDGVCVEQTPPPVTPVSPSTPVPCEKGCEEIDPMALECLTELASPIAQLFDGDRELFEGADWSQIMYGAKITLTVNDGHLRNSLLKAVLKNGEELQIQMSIGLTVDAGTLHQQNCYRITGKETPAPNGVSMSFVEVVGIVPCPPKEE